MIPADKDFLFWLDDDGDLRKDAPLDIKEQYEQWERHQTERDKMSLESEQSEEI